ncbi:hypothetical protein [Halorubrum sp. FL23]|jgi:multisubunit Na+/H+ antiporter MnhC subunit|uniref:hypothetical protein n=1 Tax=Halorubrum sp. FL23 TaxID=3458704 RepID=UPI00403388D3
MSIDNLGKMIGIAALAGIVILAGSFLITAQILLSVIITLSVVTTGLLTYLLWRYFGGESGGDGGNVRV